ncbi:hypothetical protein CVT24_004225 [Panaeolus cyanescens]|uniref:60S ribosomal protein L37 n=1 Tax=Panaeolus cyanescens TaxID=181874 RepID=A0A409YSS2_9AGAR|nr:hypothetical protein CVT24_004225 [Panaeolus cyanescens]
MFRINRDTCNLFYDGTCSATGEDRGWANVIHSAESAKRAEILTRQAINQQGGPTATTYDPLPVILKKTARCLEWSLIYPDPLRIVFIRQKVPRPLVRDTPSPTRSAGVVETAPSTGNTKVSCASCGYPSAKIRSYEWGQKAKRRKTTGTGRMRYLKDVSRRFKNGFRENTVAKKRASTKTDA